MKAIIHTKYGSPEVAQLKEVEKPLPKENEVLIKVMATTVNRTDCGFQSAEYFISRFWSGLFAPKQQILGCEFAGEIVEIGQKVTGFKVGDKVFGYNDEKFGGHAEFLVIAENAALTHIPKNMTYQEIAPSTEGGHYALCNIRASKIQKGQNCLVYGATGAIGTAAVQLLTHMGVKVTAVCNTKNVELVKSLGAITVIDYQTQDFTKLTTKFDFVFDSVGKTSFKVCQPLMTSNGVYISTELGKNGENIFLALTTPLFSSQKVLFPLPIITVADVVYLKELMESGKYKPVIDRTYNLTDIVEAYKYVETRQKTGNVVITV